MHQHMQAPDYGLSMSRREKVGSHQSRFPRLLEVSRCCRDSETEGSACRLCVLRYEDRIYPGTIKIDG